MSGNCRTDILCSSFNGKVSLHWAMDKQEYLSRSEYGKLRLHIDAARLADPAIGQCNNEAIVASCSNITSHCASLERFRAGFVDKMQKIVLTPELICEPFIDNPPYICSKKLSPNVPSILSQALAFFTGALAATKMALFFCAEMRHNCRNKSPSRPGTIGDVKVQKVAPNLSDTSAEMRSFEDERQPSSISDRIDPSHPNSASAEP
jgi:hypothetical protein